MNTVNRWEPFRNAATLHEQLNRVFGEGFHRQEESNLGPKDLDIRVQNHILAIRGKPKFEKQVNDSNYLRVERAYGSFARSFQLANTVNSEAIKADYQDGVLTLHIPKREEAKPKQIKVNVGTPAVAGAAGAR
jgi:HSP20 family protein